VVVPVWWILSKSFPYLGTTTTARPGLGAIVVIVVCCFGRCFLHQVLEWWRDQCPVRTMGEKIASYAQTTAESLARARRNSSDVNNLNLAR
jgi:hypothetical protein